MRSDPGSRRDYTSDHRNGKMDCSTSPRRSRKTALAHRPSTVVSRRSAQVPGSPGEFDAKSDITPTTW